MRKQTYFWAVLFCTVSLLMGADWYVDPAGSADPDGSMEHPFPTIQQALDAAQPHDRILLQPGVYTGEGNCSLNPEGKTLIIQSIQPENLQIAASTIIDPNGLGRGFIFNHNEDPDFILQGLTIRNTLCQLEENPAHGSAIFCSGASPTVRFCIFENCNADGGWGGAFYGEFCNSTLEHCLFAGNHARYGGALAVNLSSNLSVNHCTLAGNQAWFAGGGIISDFESPLSLKNTIVHFNSLDDPAGQGKQISIRGNSTVAVSFSSIANAPGDIELWEESALLFQSGVLHTDPCFARCSTQLPIKEMDFHLKSCYGRWDPLNGSWVQDSETSPCINAGDPNENWASEPWPNGKRVNIGFYGGTEQASMYGNPADFNIDHSVNLLDLSELLEVWLEERLSDIHDLNRDGQIDLLDLEQFSRHWLYQE